MVKDGIFLGKRYEIIDKIGAGGMADVYKGKDHMLNRYIAVKVLKKEFREDENFVRKFRSEAQAAAGLMHPNIVNVYDVGEDRGLYYMVMELVEGITLKEYIDRKTRLSFKEVISIAIQVCSGIEAAHNQHIIHRDIKPHNIIISKDGKVKVTDFGIARMTTSNTVSTNAMGSVHYTSPEQARGGYSDAKSDIYSVGITLYEMVTGQVPFNGESTVEVAVKHLQEEIVPPSELVPDIPYSLEQIILKCTQKNSERRYSTTGELIQDLKHSLVDPDGDFVEMIPLRNADTVIISESELDDIRNSYSDDEDYGYEDDDDYDDDYEYDDDYDDDDDDDAKAHSSDDVNPRMNKVMKILTIVVAVIIVLVLGLVVGKATGLLKFGSKITAEDSKEKVKVPSVIGKTEDEAKKILNAKGLGVKIKARRESNKYEAGVVMEQDPGEGKRVAKNTQIEIVISSKLVGEELTVPDVAGKDEADAQKMLEDAGFEKITSEAVYSDKPQGEVIGTTPAANSKATKDTEIKMQVSKGEEKKTVPDLLGSTEADARNAITAAGLAVADVTYDYNESYPEGTVYSQSLAKGTKVTANTSINIAVSRGKKPEEKINVPSVIGASESSAKQMIINAGLTVSDTVTYTNSDTVPAGCVISCNPGVGTSLSKGSTVSLTVSQGPNTPEPDVDEEE